MRHSSQPARGPVMPALTDCGVSADADPVYRRKVTFGARTSAALARDLGISRRRVADVPVGLFPIFRTPDIDGHCGTCV